MLSIGRIKYYLYCFSCYFVDSLLFLMPREIRRYKGIIFLIILLEGKKLKADPDHDETLHNIFVPEELEYDQDNDFVKSKKFSAENHNKMNLPFDCIKDVNEDYIYGLAAIHYKGTDIQRIQNSSQEYQTVDKRSPIFENFTDDRDLKKEVIPKILKKEVTDHLQQNSNLQDGVKSIDARGEQNYSPVAKFQALEELNLLTTVVAVEEFSPIVVESENPYSQDSIHDSINQLIARYQDLQDEGQMGEFPMMLVNEGSIGNLNQFTRESSFSVQLIREDSSQDLQDEGQMGEFPMMLVREDSIGNLNQFTRENSFSVQLIREDSNQNLQAGQMGEFSGVIVREGSMRNLNQITRENSFSVQLIREDSNQNLQNQPEIQDGTPGYSSILKILIGGGAIVGGVVVIKKLLGDNADTITTDLETTFAAEEIS